MMKTPPTYSSDEEILRQLHEIIKNYSGQLMWDSMVPEAKDLAEELAGRIYDEPEKWGIDRIPPNFRNDVVQDIFTQMVTSDSSLRGRRSAPSWFADAAEERFRTLWALHRSVAANKPRQANGGKTARFSTAREFTENDGAWRNFEREFSADALILSLRYMQRQSLKDIASRLGASSSKAAETRVAHARRRFIMFCENTGYDRKQVASLLKRFQEE